MLNKEIPNHLGIILDGNRRWAQEKRLPARAGHKKGAETTKKIIDAVREAGVKILTLFVFSTENWSRDKKETNYLMKLLERALAKYSKEAGKRGIKIRVIGQIKNFSTSLQKSIKHVEEMTGKNKNMIVNFALSYGGRAEIVEAIKKIVQKRIAPENITEEVVKENLWTSDVDLIIRTGREQRISNFLIWQSAYSEFYFSQKYWPDFTKEDLQAALLDYQARKRRFGV